MPARLVFGGKPRLGPAGRRLRQMSPGLRGALVYTRRAGPPAKVALGESFCLGMTGVKTTQPTAATGTRRSEAKGPQPGSASVRNERFI